MYTNIGKLVGTVVDLDMDFGAGVASALQVKLKKPVESKSMISVPFSWVKAIGDIILIKKPG